MAKRSSRGSVVKLRFGSSFDKLGSMFSLWPEDVATDSIESGILAVRRVQSVPGVMEVARSVRGSRISCHEDLRTDNQVHRTASETAPDCGAHGVP